MEITRREALKAVAGTATLATLAALPFARGADRPPSPASASSFHLSACRWCYDMIPLEDLARAARWFGLESIELLDPAEWPVVRKYGLTCAMANGTTTIPNGLNRIENHAAMVPSMIERIGACADAGLPNVICFPGSRAGMDDEQGLENCAVALKRIVPAAEKRGVTGREPSWG